MCQVNAQPAPDSVSVCDNTTRVLSGCMSVLLTCPGTLCRHIDEVRNTWRQCRGKGCQELWASWAERAETNGPLVKQQGLVVAAEFKSLTLTVG